MMIIVKMADISNECRPMEVSEPWLECLLQEFFNQVMKDGAELLHWTRVNNFKSLFGNQYWSDKL